MEDKNIIIVLLIIVVVILAAMVAMMVMPSIHAQKDSKITITGNKTLYVGDDLAIKLTDLNKTPIKKAVVNVTITDKSGKVVANKSVKTDSKGKAKLELDVDAGKYTVNATFGGNDNFTGNTTSKNITIEEAAVEEPVKTQQDTASYSESSSSDKSDYRPAVDSGGITREEADYWGWEYTTDHGGHYIGTNDHWDEKAGMYHD